MPFEYGGQIWPDSPWVTRTREVKLLHTAPDSIDFYRCQYTNGVEVLSYREDNVTIARDHSTFIMDAEYLEDGSGIHTGTLRMGLTPGQPGDIRCKAGSYATDEMRDIAHSASAYRQWEAEHPNETWSAEILWSDWSNSLPIGPVSPDPVPEPGVVLMLLIGVIGLWVVGWRRKTR